MAEETRDDAEQVAEPGPAKRSRGLVVGAFAIALCAGGALGWLLLGPRLLPAADAAAATAEVDGSGEGKKRGAKSEPRLHMLENIVVNPAGSQGTRFLVATLALELDGAASVTVLTDRDAEVRDALIGVLGARTVTELSDVALRDVLKADLAAALTPLLASGRVISVYLPQFVIQ